MERMRTRPFLLLYLLAHWVENPLIQSGVTFCVLEDGPVQLCKKAIPDGGTNAEASESIVIAATGHVVSHDLAREVGQRPGSLS